MKLLIPVFPKDKNEENILWHNIDKTPLCLYLANKLSDGLQEAVIFMTGSSKVFDHAMRMGMNPILIDCHEEIKNSALPFGTQSCLAHLRDKKKLNQDEPIFIINYRYPFLTQKMLSEVYRIFIQSKGLPVIGMAPLQDHPAQMECYYKTQYLDNLVLFDSNFNHKPRLAQIHDPQGFSFVTRPFYLNWLGFGIMGNNESYVMATQGKKSMMVPAKRQALNGNNFIDQDYFIYIKPDSARKIVSLKQPNEKIDGKRLAGVSTFYSSRQSNSLLLEDTKDNTIHIYINASLVKKNTEFRIWSFCENKVQVEKNSTCFGGDCMSFSAIRDHKSDSEMTGPIAIFKKKREVDGYILAVLERCSKQGGTDFSEPLQLVGGNYDVDLETHKRINTITGKIITGYQDLPTMYEANSALTMLKAKDAIHIEKMMAIGQVMGYPINYHLACRLDSEMGLLKFDCHRTIEA